MVWNKWNCLYNWMSSDFLKEEKIVNSALENKSIVMETSEHVSVEDGPQIDDRCLYSDTKNCSFVWAQQKRRSLLPVCVCRCFFHSWDEKMNDSVITVDVSWWEETKTSKVQVFVRRSGRPWTQSSVCHFHISKRSWIKSPHTSRAAAFKLKMN